MALDAFMKKFAISESEKGEKTINYTKIPNTELGVFGGKYHIPDTHVDELQSI